MQDSSAGLQASSCYSIPPVDPYYDALLTGGISECDYAPGSEIVSHFNPLYQESDPLPISTLISHQSPHSQLIQHQSHAHTSYKLGECSLLAQEDRLPIHQSPSPTYVCLDSLASKQSDSHLPESVITLNSRSAGPDEAHHDLRLTEDRVNSSSAASIANSSFVVVDSSSAGQHSVASTSGNVIRTSRVRQTSEGFYSSTDAGDLLLDSARGDVVGLVNETRGGAKVESYFIKCEWMNCDMTFIDFAQFVKHLENQHVNQEPKEKGRFFCLWSKCKRNRQEFNARYKLLIHMRVHSGERPFPCSYENCKKSFSRLENLKIHRRSHTGEKPYHCSHDGCNKSFTNSSDRIKHHKTHRDPKPYPCPFDGCSKRYTDPSSLRKHQRAHKRSSKVPMSGQLGSTIHNLQYQAESGFRSSFSQQYSDQMATPTSFNQQNSELIGSHTNYCGADFDPCALIDSSAWINDDNVTIESRNHCRRSHQSISYQHSERHPSKLDYAPYHTQNDYIQQQQSQHNLLSQSWAGTTSTIRARRPGLWANFDQVPHSAGRSEVTAFVSQSTSSDGNLVSTDSNRQPELNQLMRSLPPNSSLTGGFQTDLRSSGVEDAQISALDQQVIMGQMA